MKNFKYLILMFMGLVAFNACTDDEVSEIQQSGNPVLTVDDQFADVHFGDVVPFTVSVSDELSLSTLAAILYFGEEEVERTTIRTKEDGEYSGTIEVPFSKDIPDGTATLEFVLTNTTLKQATQTFDVPITRAQYPYLILVTADASYPMLPTGEANEYAATAAFPSTDLPAYIKTPVLDDKGTEIVFGWESGAVTEGITTEIPFVSPVGGTYSVTFNILTYEAAPFFEILVDGVNMEMVDKENYQIDVDLTQGQILTIDGLDDIADWWIDADYLTKQEDGVYTFVPITGKYRISANLKLKYFRVEVLDGSSVASLNSDGTGAIWVIGDNVGKPSLTDNVVGWNTDNALCMAPIADQKYQLTVVGGQNISTDAINFKFFHQKGWGGEFGSTTISTSSDLVFVGDGTNGRDSGNLGLVSGVTLETGATYVFTVDVSAGIDQAVLTVIKQ
ncbi:DUF5125 domain-containing protein [Mangrovibacterium diazotrophicum]|uniref:Uncharacterized protein DUF5016 n=1 Tax=Mangrovibacterium diazotrophicum TaxID=1261403 RepID=A0A419W644_9BACT|nr:DUF5125 domain-containing protein [Mangrovibacterium diazotrophicum]RKD90938.1 uncharacterized protein DUF5016 [Mangrovibacterium diazotrophicum]